MHKLLFIVLFLTKTFHVFSQTCEYVTSELEVKYDSSENVIADNWTPLSINGCISNTSFDTKHVETVGVYCTHISLPVLEKHFINNMEFLKFIYIDACHLYAIEPEAFFNLPQIRFININNNPLTKIPSGVFNILPSLEILHIFKCDVSEIEDDAFGNLPKLKSFGLANNKMDHIRRSWFTNTSNIEVFTIFNNLIRKIPFGMFHGWKKLKQLDLTANLISEIEAPLLKDSARFVIFIGLHRNRLRTFPLNLFPDLVFIDHIDISGNLLNYLSEEFLKNIRVSDISIFLNPFTCPCLERINRFLNQRGKTVNNPDRKITKSCQNPDVPACGFSLNSTCVDVIDKDLTDRIIAQMKVMRFDTVFDENGQQCAMFDNSD